MSKSDQKAPIPGTFRVIGVDTFDGEDWIEGDFKTLQAAKEHAEDRTKGQQMLKMHVYDFAGCHQGEFGKF